MSAPVLLAVDPDPGDLADVEGELRDRYGTSYRVVGRESPEEALSFLTDVADVGGEVALVLAAQWFSGTTGGELLERVRQLHPHAKRALLVPWRAWADRPTAEAIFDSMALGRIDYYVLRPASRPDEVFHQAITSFLLDWTRARRTAPHTIRVVAESWSGRAYELRNVLQRCALPHAFCLADSSEGQELLSRVGSEVELPIIVLPNGQILSDPTNMEMAASTGASVEVAESQFDVIVVGAGPAGLSAAVYGASEGLRTLVIDEGGLGGQATSSALIRNYLGFPRGISGGRLAEQAYEQAWVFGASFAFMQAATDLGREADRTWLALADGRRVSARAVILCPGAAYRRLGVPALEALNGAGVFYGGPASEGHALTDRMVYVVGGGNSAGQAALYLSRYARRVTLVVRARSLGAGMSHYLVQELQATHNVEVRTGTTVVGGGGDGWLQHLVLRDNGTSTDETVAADALFVLIGARPHTAWLPDEVARDQRGFVLTGADVPADRRRPLGRRPFHLETSMPGVFAAGDVRQGSVKRVASAVGEGSIAIQQIHAFFASRKLDRGPEASGSVEHATGSPMPQAAT
jgi:thioredoxin reductase (NADPH)